jgi:chorismate mutase
MKNNITILQPDRWAEILTKSRQKALEININPEFVGKIFAAIHEESINRQTKIMNENGN